MQDEFAQLHRIERPKLVETVSWAAGNGDRSENGDYIYGKRRLREIDRRLRFLRKRMEVAEVVDPARQTNRTRVFFGARVEYLTSQNETKRLRIVGVDEARSELGEVQLDFANRQGASESRGRRCRRAAHAEGRESGSRLCRSMFEQTKLILPTFRKMPRTIPPPT